MRTRQKAKRHRLGKRPRLTPERSYDVWRVVTVLTDPSISTASFLPGSGVVGVLGLGLLRGDLLYRLTTRDRALDRNKPCRPERGGKSTLGPVRPSSRIRPPFSVTALG